MHRLAIRWLSLVTLLALVACGATAVPANPTPAGTAPPAARTASPSTPSGAGRKVTIALGYIPDVQFAPFYVARERGYFRAEGLDVDFKQGFGTDVLKLVATASVPFGVASGDETLVARSQGLPIVYVAAWYEKFPITVIARESAGVRQASDLKGRTIGVPGRFGATYVGLLALLNSVGLKETDVHLREIGFNQVQALAQGQVDIAVGYTNNEPVQLRQLGVPITTINVFDRVTLASNGIITNEQTVKNDPELVRAVVRAYLRGLQETIANPDAALDLVIASAVPEAAAKRDQARAVLAASIPLWQSPLTARQGLGAIDPDAWTTTRDVLRTLGILGSDVDLTGTYTTTFLPSQP